METKGNGSRVENLFFCGVPALEPLSLASGEKGVLSRLR